MDTKLLATNSEDIKIAADILKNGGNVIFPTETVYGLGADALNAEAVKNIFKAKGRPSDNPLIVHISSVSMLKDIVEEIPEPAKKLMDKFWPGPLTIILKKSKIVPYETTAGLDTVAVRMPKNETARELIECSGIPVAAPSANLSGKPSPTSAKHCIDDMMGRVDAILSGEECEVGLESTVIDMSGIVPILLRPGGVTLEELEEVIGKVETVSSVKEGETPKSPGLKYRHYSPNAEVMILSGTFDETTKYVKEQSLCKKVGVLVFDEFPQIEGVYAVSLGSSSKPQDAANRLFSALRQMDEIGVDVIYAPEIPQNGMWMAVQNRLYRAAGEKIINVSNISDRPKTVLFICTGNTCRSPMAEAIFNQKAKNAGLNYSALSAGVYADGTVTSKNSITVLKENGFEFKERKSIQLDDEIISSSDIILTMTKSQRYIVSAYFNAGDKVKTLPEYVGETIDVFDPFGGDTNEYRKCYKNIEELIDKMILKLQDV